MLLRQELAPAIIDPEPIITCRHYWLIEPAEGPMSRGVCHNCQESRDFQNSIVEAEKEY